MKVSSRSTLGPQRPTTRITWERWEQGITSSKFASTRRTRFGSCCTADRAVWGTGSARILSSLRGRICGDYRQNLPDIDLAYFEEGTKFFSDYVEAVGWAQDYARWNRRIMMDNVVSAVRHSGEVPPFYGRGAGDQLPPQLRRARAALRRGGFRHA